MEGSRVQAVVQEMQGEKIDIIPWSEDLATFVVNALQPATVARVVIDERSGTIVMGPNVRIDTVAIAQGQLTVRITETPQVSQPSPFSNTGVTTVVPRTNIDVEDDSDRRLAILEDSVTLEELVAGLNSLGVGPRDLISILQSIKSSGALQADIMVQ